MKQNWLGWALMLAVGGCSSEEPSRDDAGATGQASEPVEDAGAPTGDSGAGASDGALLDSSDSSDVEAGLAGSLGDAAPSALDAAQVQTADADANLGLDGASAIDAATLDASVPQGGDAASSGGAPSDAATGDGEVTREQYCAGRGSVIKVPGAAAGSVRPVCTGTVARQRFKNALCACEDVVMKGFLNTGSFSASEDAPGTFTKAGGSVGINGSVGVSGEDLAPWDVAAGYADVGGSLRVYGPGSYAGYIHVYGDYELNGDTTVGGYVQVERDLRMRGDLVLLGHANIGRDLYMQPDKWGPPFWSMLGGRSIVKEFALDKPCACEPSDLLDVDAIVRDGKLHNDNDNPAVMLRPSALTRLDFARRLELPCGRFYVDEISGVGDLHLVVNGRTALFVGGDVATIGHFDVEIGPQGELDLFIAGDLAQVGYGVFGDVSRPSAVRVYVGGEGDIFFRGYQPFGANLYAPKSRLHSDGFIDMKGSLFVRRIDDNGYLKVNYDRDILNQGGDDACLPPPPPPPPQDAGVPDASQPPPEEPPQCSNVCDDLCGQKACKSGMCAGCTSDSDCCEPLVCYPDGRCGPLLL